MPNWKQLGDNLLSVFLQPNCPCCGRSAESVLCVNCNRQLEECRFSQSKFQGKGKIPVLAWGKYEGMLKRAIASLKYEQKPEIARPLGEKLGETWLKTATFPTSLQPVVIPIPLHPEKEKQRGYNQAQLIARSFCQVTNFPLHTQGLKRIKNTEALFGLTPQQRQQQLDRAFTVGKKLNPKQPIILLDDIYTTGTTAQAAQITLQQVGGKVLAVTAVAKPEKNKIA
ncbi:MAG: ComF family protein [Halothece sp.]